MEKPTRKTPPEKNSVAKPASAKTAPVKSKTGTKEHGGPKGPEPTRYGDWEKSGRCSDF